MSDELRIGLIGLDTSHVIRFTELLSDTERDFHVPGGRVTVGYRGGSADFEQSYSRVQGFTAELADRYGIRIVETPEQVAERADAILLTSVDGRVHREQFERVAPYRKPVFVDKPFAVTTEDAKAIFAAATTNQVPVMSASSYRYSEALQTALAELEASEILGADCWGAMPLEETQPGLFWYGIHTVEMLYTVLGTGCQRVHAEATEDFEQVTGVWADGRIGTVRGLRKGQSSFGALIHYAGGSRYVDVQTHPKPSYAGLLEQILRMFRTDQPSVDSTETLEIISFIEAANRSRQTGQSIALPATANQVDHAGQRQHQDAK